MNINIVSQKAFKFGESKTWTQVAANTTAEQTVAAPGVTTGDTIVLVNKPTHQAGLDYNAIARVAANDQLTIKFNNPTAAGITPTAEEAWTGVLMRFEVPLETDASQ